MTRNRQSNRPDRRIAPANTLSLDELERIETAVVYSGASYHKLHPGNYGFDPPSNPRPSKSVCDDYRNILKDEAIELLRAGIRRGMVSRPKSGRLPKYVWTVDAGGEPYEAKTEPDRGGSYHGYRLGDKDPQMRAEVLKEWNKR